MAGKLRRPARQLEVSRRGKLRRPRWLAPAGPRWLTEPGRHLGDIELLAQQAEGAVAKFGVACKHIVFPPHCFKYSHDAAGKLLAENVQKGIMSRAWTISDVSEHYDYNAATMVCPTPD